MSREASSRKKGKDKNELGKMRRRIVELEGLEAAHKQVQEELRKKVEELRRTMKGTIYAMALTVEMRDPYIAGHQRNVTDLVSAIAKTMELSDEEAEGIRLAAAIHDVGRTAVPIEIFAKPAQLSDPEFAIVKTHPKVGHDILKMINFPWPIAEITFQHHERMDGSGYPRHLSGKDIILGARIVAVGDVVEAMCARRPHRPAQGIEKALEEITKNRETLYDPKVVDACLQLFQEKEFGFGQT